MKTILLYTSPARGHLYPMMDVALALRDAGHRVVVQTLADEADRVRSEGLEHRPIHPRIESIVLDDYREKSPIAQLRQTFRRWVERAPFELEDLGAARGEIDPDLLLVDVNTWGASALAEAEGRSWAMFLPYVLPVPSRDAPVFGPGFRPPRGPLGRLRDRLLWRAVGAATATELRAWNALRAEVGLPPHHAFPDHLLRPPLLIQRTAEPFGYPRSDAPPNLRRIGPGLWAPGGDLPPWLHELPRPRILVSVSTEFQGDDAIPRAALDGLANEEGSVIITTAALDPVGFTPPNDRMRVVRFLPHAKVIPEVDLVVTHGGMGTTQRALAAGVPVVVVPWGRDQGETARRVELCGAGCRLPRSRLSPAHLRLAVREAKGRKEGAERVARAFREAGGAPRAVELLEGMLSRPRPRTSPR